MADLFFILFFYDNARIKINWILFQEANEPYKAVDVEAI